MVLQLDKETETKQMQQQPLQIQSEEAPHIWWLNDESEQMLNRGYLLKGETVEGAIERITDRKSVV